MERRRAVNADMRVHFGKYAIPPTLRKLMEFSDELGDAERFYRGLQFYLEPGSLRYFNTPCDVVVFGSIGVDGIHYGFLTDFGSAPDLETAPIVCVDPMNFDRPTKIVANNLREFLSVNLTDAGLFYNHFESEDGYLETKRRWMEEAARSPYRSGAEEAEREAVVRRLKDRILLPPVDNPYQYVRKVGEERRKAVTVPTQDGLGVTAPLREGERHVPFPVSKDRPPDPEALKAYLNSAPLASRLALIRDIQMNFVLEIEHALRAAVLEAMDSMGLTDEAARLSVRT